MSAILTFTLAMAIQTAARLEHSKMERQLFPSWESEVDEEVTSDSAEFGACNDAVKSYAALLDDKVSQTEYSVSKRWGRIVRARLSGEYKGRPGTTLVTCWSTSDSDVEIAVKGAAFRE